MKNALESKVVLLNCLFSLKYLKGTEMFIAETCSQSFEIFLFVFVCQVCSLLRSSVQGLDSAPKWLKQKCEDLCRSDRPPGVSLYLCHGALAMLSWKGALPGPQWEQLLLLVPNALLDLDVR